MSELGTGLVGVGGALLGAVVGAVVGGYVTYWIAKKKHEEERKHRQEVAERSVASEIRFLLQLIEHSSSGSPKVRLPVGMWDKFHAELGHLPRQTYDQLEDGYAHMRHANSAVDAELAWGARATLGAPGGSYEGSVERGAALLRRALAEMRCRNPALHQSSDGS